MEENTLRTFEAFVRHFAMRFVIMLLAAAPTFIGCRSVRHHAFGTPIVTCSRSRLLSHPRLDEQRTPGLGGRVPSRRPPPPPFHDDVRSSSSVLDTSRRPRGARTRISSTDAGTLVIDVPAAGLSTSTLFGGAFTAAWFSAIVPATFSAGAPLLFMAPFWLAGGLVAKQTLFDPAKATSLSVGEFAWDMTQSVAGFVKVASDGGPTSELDGASVDVSAFVNGVPVYVCRLVAGADEWTIGDGLPESELQWIALEVNAHLAALKAQR